MSKEKAGLIGKFSTLMAELEKVLSHLKKSAGLGL